MTTTQTQPVQWLTRKEAQARAGVSLSTIDRHLSRGELTRHVRGANAVRISTEELDALYTPRPVSV